MMLITYANDALTDHCFCVTEITGTVVKGSKVPHTKPDCSQYDLTEEDITPTPSF